MPVSPVFHLIATGGTIDSYYNTDQCTPQCFDNSTLPKALADNVQLSPEHYHFTQVCMKDSREITEADLEQVCQAIVDSPLKALVVTHGSFTVFESARWLAAQRTRFADKSVVLTGALYPIQGFYQTDGLFNLGASAMACQLAAPGVYVCIEGQLHHPDSRQAWH